MNAEAHWKPEPKATECKKTTNDFIKILIKTFECYGFWAIHKGTILKIITETVSEFQREPSAIIMTIIVIKPISYNRYVDTDTIRCRKGKVKSLKFQSMWQLIPNEILSVYFLCK